MCIMSAHSHIESNMDFQGYVHLETFRVHTFPRHLAEALDTGSMLETHANLRPLPARIMEDTMHMGGGECRPANDVEVERRHGKNGSVRGAHFAADG
jgi:hypothetical protein